MKIPIFLSCPTSLSDDQEAAREIIIAELESQQFEARALGRSDHPADSPLREVHSIAQICAGGIILGFSQFETESGVWKKGTTRQTEQEGVAKFPTPWNQLEAGILFGLRIPLLVFRESGITGGIFDIGTSDLFINNVPKLNMDDYEREGLHQVILKWASRVRTFYYSDRR